MIELANVTKTYASQNGDVRALDDVSLTIDAGEFVAVRGPSGCGKSTLLALIGGLAQPTGGKVVVDGREISAMSSAARAHYRAESIGFVFQMFHLLPYLNIVDNVLVAAPPGRGAELRPRAMKLLESFGLSERKSHVPSQLSIGERQRVAMARALLNEPRLLLADEPTGNLDEENAESVMQWLADFHGQGGTILLVTHEQHAARFAQRTISLREGKVGRESLAAGG